ncbi:MAG: FlgD immunoglobulin-like domain containing protein [bacterium]
MRNPHLVAIIVTFSIGVANLGFAQYPIFPTRANHLIRVDVSTQWINTGLQLTQGEEWIVHAGGWYCLDTADILETTAWSGPDGHKGYPHETNKPLVNLGALIGKIGANGLPFYIGSFNTIRAEVSGTLYLGVYDPVHWDNEGEAIVFMYGPMTRPEPTSVAENSNSSTTSAGYVLSQNYPNPFNPTTTIKYSVQKAGHVLIKIFNLLGQEIKTLVENDKPPGEYSVAWDGTNDNGIQLPSGQYYYQLKVGDFMSSKKMVLLR